MNRKIGLLSVFLLCFTNKSFAELYFKAGAGGTLFEPTRENYNNSIIANKNPAYFMEYSIGEQFFTHFRADIKYSKTIGSKLNSKLVEHKPKIDLFSSNIYFDLFKFYNSRAYIGAGIGMSLLQDRVKLFNTDNSVLYEAKLKEKYKLAYSLSAGFHTYLFDQFFSDISYVFNDYGITKKNLYNGLNIGNITLKSHNIVVSLRYNFNN